MKFKFNRASCIFTCLMWEPYLRQVSQLFSLPNPPTLFCPTLYTSWSLPPVASISCAHLLVGFLLNLASGRNLEERKQQVRETHFSSLPLLHASVKHLWCWQCSSLTIANVCCFLLLGFSYSGTLVTLFHPNAFSFGSSNSFPLLLIYRYHRISSDFPDFAHIFVGCLLESSFGPLS